MFDRGCHWIGGADMPSMSAATPPSEKTFSLVPFIPNLSIEPAKLIGLCASVAGGKEFVAPTFRSASGQIAG